LVLCVAAHDIGEYVRHYPHGKKYFTLSLKWVVLKKKSF